LNNVQWQQPLLINLLFSSRIKYHSTVNNKQKWNNFI